MEKFVARFGIAAFRLTRDRPARFYKLGRSNAGIVVTPKVVAGCGDNYGVEGGAEGI